MLHVIHPEDTRHEARFVADLAGLERALRSSIDLIDEGGNMCSAAMALYRIGDRVAKGAAMSEADRQATWAELTRLQRALSLILQYEEAT